MPRPYSFNVTASHTSPPDSLPSTYIAVIGNSTTRYRLYLCLSPAPMNKAQVIGMIILRTVCIEIGVKGNEVTPHLWCPVCLRFLTFVFQTVKTRGTYCDCAPSRFRPPLSKLHELCRSFPGSISTQGCYFVFL
ncbi:hypothetical protein ARMSODRAFT_358 [Armillaria solidipes]|uniref:Uncharacterized protein n=1 Tax=Armillaria solidipes TaxID=1076256 RepID=A0A2H3C3H9_9AGAR|nr:hypothetical protein ARMSODRAFT_358 [Armillaria solidipes]